MLDVGFAFVEFVDFGFVDVEAQNLITDVHIAEHQWQADVAQADDADFGGFICKFLNGNIFHDKSHVMEKGVPHSAKCRIGTPAGCHKAAWSESVLSVSKINLSLRLVLDVKVLHVQMQHCPTIMECWEMFMQIL